jgi:1-phosphofructokinase family hexose kinase
VALPILVASPNLSLDRTIAIDSLDVGHVHRSTRSDARGGGKGINVARALKCIGVDALVVGVVAGRTGEAVASMLEEEGIAVVAVRAAGETRSCLTVLSQEGTTVFNEPGPVLDARAWRRFADAVGARVASEGVFVCSGSFPPGAPDDGAATLLSAARARGWTTICDTSRAQLENALASPPDVVVPNLAEASAVLDGAEGEPVEAGASALRHAERAARALVQRGPPAAVVTVGAAGAATHRHGRSRQWPAHDVEAVNPVGAGDCLVAGMASVVAEGGDFDAAMERGMAMAAAGCETFPAGALHRARYLELIGLR